MSSTHASHVCIHALSLYACRLSYDEGEDEESFEWVDFRELTDSEVRQHPSYIVVQPRPPPAAAAASAPSTSAAKPPAKAAKAGYSNPEQVSPFTSAAQHCGSVSQTAPCSVISVVPQCLEVITEQSPA